MESSVVGFFIMVSHHGTFQYFHSYYQEPLTCPNFVHNYQGASQKSKDQILLHNFKIKLVHINIWFLMLFGLKLKLISFRFFDFVCLQAFVPYLQLPSKDNLLSFLKWCIFLHCNNDWVQQATWVNHKPMPMIYRMPHQIHDNAHVAHRVPAMPLAHQSHCLLWHATLFHWCDTLLTKGGLNGDHLLQVPPLLLPSHSNKTASF